MEFDVQGIGIHVVQIYLHFKKMLTGARLHLHLSESNVQPILAQIALPLE